MRAMQTYVSFLRGINVGGRSIKMVDLKECFEKAGYFDVITLLQSGNVVFRSETPGADEVRSTLEIAVAKRFDYPAKLLVLKREQLSPIVRGYPFDRLNDDYQHYILFLLPGVLDGLMRFHTELDKSIEEIARGDGVLYWKVRKGMTLDSAFAKVLTKAEFKEFHTSRNIKTVQKLV